VRSAAQIAAVAGDADRRGDIGAVRGRRRRSPAAESNRRSRRST
jgi:hypothetical protein